MMFFIGANAWAENIAYKTLTFSSSTNSNGVQNYTSTWTATVDDFTWSLTNFNNNNNGWNYVRCGSKSAASTATISTSNTIDEAITQVVVTVDKTSNCNSNKLEVATDASFSSNLQTITGTMAAGDVTYTIPTPTANCYYRLTYAQAKGSNNGETQISKVVYYKTDSSTPVKTPIATIGDLTPTELALNATGTFTLPITVPEGLTADEDYEISWTSSDESMLYLNGAEYRAGETKGNVTVTVNVEALDEDTYSNVSKTFTIHIYDPNANDGLSQETAFTVAEAIEAIDYGVSSSDTYYVKGVISQVDSYNSNYSSITYWISDDGTTNNQMEVYSGKGLNGADFASKDDLSVGDEVVVKGNLKLYGSIHEFDKNNELVSHKTKATATLTFSPATLPEMMVGDEDITLTLTTDFDGDIVAISSNDDIATITESGANVWTIHAVAKGNVTFTFMADATEAFKAIEEELDMTVKPSNKIALDKTIIIDDWTGVSGSYYTTATDVEISNYVFTLTQCCKQTTLQFRANAGVLVSPVVNSENGYTVIMTTSDDSNSTGELTLQIADEDAVIVVGGGKSVMATTTSTAASFTIKNLHAGAMKVEKLIVMPNINVTSHGWATFITPTAMTFAAGNAYVVTEASVADGLTTAEVTSVPANTPVLLKGAGLKSFTLAEDVAAPATNLLSICNGTVESGKYAYVLAKDGSSACFKQWTGEASKLNGRVVLLLDETVAAARSIFALDDDGATGIETVNGDIVNNKYYDLQGRRVMQPKNGLYIVNGKKIIKH